MTTEPTPKKKSTRARNEMPLSGPPPSHILLDAISDALKGGVPLTEVIFMIDMAREAYGTDQGMSWKLVAKKLNRSTANHVSDLLTEQTSTLPGDVPDAG